jgi:hypothetical protein
MGNPIIDDIAVGAPLNSVAMELQRKLQMRLFLKYKQVQTTAVKQVTAI